MAEEQLTPEEQQALEEAMKSYGAPQAEDKHNVHTFLHKVSTSLSKDAKLIELAVMQRREIADVTKRPMKENRGWFKGKQNNQQETQQ